MRVTETFYVSREFMEAVRYTGISMLANEGELITSSHIERIDLGTYQITLIKLVPDHEDARC